MYDTDIESIPPDKCFTFARPALPGRTGRLISDDLLGSAWARCEFFVGEVLTHAPIRGISLSVLPVLGSPLVSYAADKCRFGQRLHHSSNRRQNLAHRRTGFYGHADSSTTR
jgi:hypothetical protein